MTSTSSPRSQSLVSAGLLALAVVLLVTHFALDAGAGREAPRGLLWAAIAFAVAAAFLGVTGRTRRR